MFKKSLFLSFAVLMSLTVLSFAASDGSWTGWLSDAACASNYTKSASAGHVGCAKMCANKPSGKWALSTPDGALILELGDIKVDPHLGHEVVVSGSMDGNTVAVGSIQASK